MSEVTGVARVAPCPAAEAVEMRMYFVVDITARCVVTMPDDGHVERAANVKVPRLVPPSPGYFTANGS